MTARPHNGRFRANHSPVGSVTVGILILVLIFIGLLTAGAFA